MNNLYIDIYKDHMQRAEFTLRPASREEAELFYSQEDQDEALGTVGHLRMDFGSGNAFWHTWWPHNEDRFNTPAFKEALQKFVDGLRTNGLLQSQAAMSSYCWQHAESQIAEGCFGFVAETEDYRFCLRCTTGRGEYSYLYCYDLHQQQMVMEDNDMAMGGLRL